VCVRLPTELVDRQKEAAIELATVGDETVDLVRAIPRPDVSGRCVAARTQRD
jgi:hypothetical protein